MFDAKSFTVTPTAPLLAGGIGQGGPLDQFVKVFGSHWKKTPYTGVYFIGIDGIQFSLCTRRNEIASYREDTVKEFKDKFKHLEGIYYPLNSTFKYTGLDVIEALKKEGLWERILAM